MPELPQGWVKNRIRARAEPLLNQWVGTILGDPNHILYRVQYYDKSGTKIGDAVQFNLAEKFCPLDLLYTMPVGERPQLSELEQQLINKALFSMTRPSGTQRVELIFKRDPSWEPTDLSVPEVLEIARAVRDLISRTRPIDVRDLTIPGATEETGVDLVELKTRISRTLGAGAKPGVVDLFKDDIAALEKSIETPIADSLRIHLLQLSPYDIPGTVPISTIGESQTEVSLLLEQAQRVLKEAQRRQDEIDQLINQIGKNGTSSQLVGLLQKLFGEHFQVLPRFKMPSNGLTKAVHDAINEREQRGDAEAADTFPWLERIGRVREVVDRFNMVLSYSDVLKAESSIQLNVAQLSTNEQADEKWIAHKLDENQRFNNGQLSLVIATPEKLPSITQPLAGLFIDEWIEVVPEREETTAVTFHYDAPGARAPQAILMAVPPVIGQKWDWNSLSAVLQETLELAKIRGIDPDIVANMPLGQYLPALFLAYNVGSQEPAGDTISTPFREK